VYYGFPFPNTAYAKLLTGWSRGALIKKGISYVYGTAWFDPVTIPVIALCVLALVPRSQRRDWPLVAGVCAYGAYVVAIGGDFMFGRFFTPLFVWSIGVLSRTRWPRERAMGLSAAAVLVVLGLCAPWEPAVFSGFGFWRVDNLLHGNTSRTPLDNYRYLRRGDVDDERRMYYDTTGLMQQRGARPVPSHIWAIEGEALRTAGRPVVVEDSVGFRGYFAGPGVHIVDRFALCDPLLARLRPAPGGRIGHFTREVPDGYLQTLSSGTNRISNPDIAAYYDRLRLVVAGPIWNVARFKAMVELWTRPSVS